MSYTKEVIDIREAAIYNLWLFLEQGRTHGARNVHFSIEDDEWHLRCVLDLCLPQEALAVWNKNRFYTQETTINYESGKTYFRCNVDDFDLVLPLFLKNPDYQNIRFSYDEDVRRFVNLFIRLVNITHPVVPEAGIARISTYCCSEAWGEEFSFKMLIQTIEGYYYEPEDDFLPHLWPRDKNCTLILGSRETFPLLIKRLNRSMSYQGDILSLFTPYEDLLYTEALQRVNIMDFDWVEVLGSNSDYPFFSSLFGASSTDILAETYLRDSPPEAENDRHTYISYFAYSKFFKTLPLLLTPLTKREQATIEQVLTDLDCEGFLMSVRNDVMVNIARMSGQPIYTNLEAMKRELGKQRALNLV